jgi:hypothetical protein
LPLAVLVLVFAFTPISHVLLSSVHGSFAPSPYSSLALRTPSNASVGFLVGNPVDIELANHTGHNETYHWSATEGGALISLGEETVKNGRTTTISVPTRGAKSGTMRVALNGTDVFVTVPLQKL